MRRLPALLTLATLMWLANWSLARPAWHPERIVQAAALHGELAEQAARQLRAAMEGALGSDELSRVAAVNEFYNQRLRYRDDIETWAQVDYWASPLETLQQGAGDCEDFAIAKYFTLVAMGLPAERLRLVYVRLAPGGDGAAVQPHMVLAYYPRPQDDPVVLDNLVPDLRQAGKRGDLAPVFSFNADGLWEGVGQVAIGGAGPVERLGRWRLVLAKAHDEGFFP